jgi:hypothetical protein
MENNQTSPQENQIIDLTSQKFIKETIKWINVIFWIGATISMFVFLQFLSQLFLSVKIPNYVGNNIEIPKSKLPAPAILMFSPAILMFSFVILNQIYKYKKSLKVALTSTNEDDLIEYNYQLKNLFKLFAFLIITAIALSVFIFVVVPLVNP